MKLYSRWNYRLELIWKKKRNLTMRKISIWKVCFQSVCLNLSILSFSWAFWKACFEIMRLNEGWGFWDTKSTIIVILLSFLFRFHYVISFFAYLDIIIPKFWHEIYNPLYLLINHLALGKRKRCSCFISALESYRIPGLICLFICFKNRVEFCTWGYSLWDLL